MLANCAMLQLVEDLIAVKNMPSVHITDHLETNQMLLSLRRYLDGCVCRADSWFRCSSLISVALGVDDRIAEVILSFLVLCIHQGLTVRWHVHTYQC